MSTPTGIGLGLRVTMADEFLRRLPKEVSWVEVHPENYIERGGRYEANLRKAREHYDVVTHGLTLSLGSTKSFDPAFLAKVRGLVEDLGAPWHSDHLCFGGFGDAFAHDLLPIPFTDEAAATAAARIREVRDALDIEIAFENVSYYAPQSEDALDEARFCAEVLERSDAKILLDVNNVYVNSQNFGFDPRAFIELIPPERVVQMHVAGHLVRPDGLRIDTHGEPVCDDVYELLGFALRHTGPRPVLLERDNNVPDVDTLLAEVRRLSAIYDEATAPTTAEQPDEAQT
ncbi:MAG: hypothetical protein ACI9KE_001584 [Polyangiales bacterium]|jgi:uncharacterized protein (UPF0276 family)